LEIRELKPHDEPALRRFFAGIPERDRTFFKEDLEEPSVLRRWLGQEQGVRLVAVDEAPELAAVGSVWPGIGRSRHVGDLRLIVASDRRRQGIGQLMARAALASALRCQMWKISVEVVAHHQPTIDMFLALGFVPEALLRDQLCSPDGSRQDVMLLSHLADEAADDLLVARLDSSA
jgi:L-amino acid N-acyltransferase YncA